MQRHSRNSAFDTPWKYLFVKASQWFLPVAFLFVVLAVVRNYGEIVSWAEEVRQWEADARRGPFHAHNRPRLDENGNPRRNPFVVIFGDVSDEDMLRSWLVPCPVHSKSVVSYSDLFAVFLLYRWLCRCPLCSCARS